jgi:GT2 family glycosyltransferase
MSEELKPNPDPSKSEKKKTSAARREQIERAKAKLASTERSNNANPIVADATYGGLREEERVVMRHQIALNIDSFRATTEDFTSRPQRLFPELTVAQAPLFSVIIPNFNGLRFLPELFEGLSRQSFRDFEIIFVDDGSTDGSVAWVEEHYPEARILVNRRNTGFVAACNLGGDAAYGRLLAFLNNDTEPEPEWLAQMALAVCDNPDTGIFASKMLLFDRRDTLHTAGDMLGIDGMPRNRGVWEVDRGQYDAAAVVFGACGGSAVYRRELWQALGGFDADFWMYLEDVDFAFRAQLLGWQARFVANARVYHRLSASSGDVMASYYVGRNMIWLLAKNMPAEFWRHNGARIVAVQLKVALDALLNWRGAAARARLRGMVAGIAGLGKQLWKRQQVQAYRQLELGRLEELMLRGVH